MVTFQNVALSVIQQQGQQLDQQLDQQWWFVLLIDTSYLRRVFVHAGTGTIHTSMLIKETSLDNFYSQIHIWGPVHPSRTCAHWGRVAWPVLWTEHQQMLNTIVGHLWRGHLRSLIIATIVSLGHHSQRWLQLNLTAQMSVRIKKWFFYHLISW